MINLFRFLENETASHIDMKPAEIIMANGQTNIVQTKTLDTVLKENNFPEPQFIKLDVQGHELEVLKGGKQAIAKADFCLLEVSLLDLGDNAPLFYEIQSYMDAQGFQAYDICQFMRRPFDKALFQMDVLFVKKNSSFVNDGNWWSTGNLKNALFICNQKFLDASVPGGGVKFCTDEYISLIKTGFNFFQFPVNYHYSLLTKIKRKLNLQGYEDYLVSHYSKQLQLLFAEKKYRCCFSQPYQYCALLQN